MTTTELNNLIDAYAMNKTELDSYDKLCKKQNVEIKAAMSELETNKVETDNYVAKVTIQERESLDEDMLLEVIRDAGLTHLIKTKEYVDMDMLENALYNNKVDADTMVALDKCRSVKQIETLRVTKRKKEN